MLRMTIPLRAVCRTVLSAIACAAACAAVSYPSSCTPSRTAASEVAVGDLAACVIRQIERDPRATPESVAAACAGVVAQDVVKILFAYRHAASASAGASPCGSSSAATPSPGSGTK